MDAGFYCSGCKKFNRKFTNETIELYGLKLFQNYSYQVGGKQAVIDIWTDHNKLNPLDIFCNWKCAKKFFDRELEKFKKDE
jgi:hypothetical protein